MQDTNVQKMDDASMTGAVTLDGVRYRLRTSTGYNLRVMDGDDVDVDPQLRQSVGFGDSGIEVVVVDWPDEVGETFREFYPWHRIKRIISFRAFVLEYRELYEDEKTGAASSSLTDNDVEDWALVPPEAFDNTFRRVYEELEAARA